MYSQPTLICEFCDKHFLATRKGQKYCNVACRNAAQYHRDHPDAGYYSRRAGEQQAKLLRQLTKRPGPFPTHSTGLAIDFPATDNLA